MKLLWSVAACGLGLSLAAVGQTAVHEYHQELRQTEKDIKQERHDLENVRQRLNQEQSIVRQKRRKERSMLFAIQQTEKQIEEAQERYQEHQHNLELVRSQIQQLRFELARTEADLGELRRLLAARLRLIYRERLNGFWIALASSRDWTEALRRMKFFHVIAVQNAHLIRRVQRQQDAYRFQNRMLGEREKSERGLELEMGRTLNTIKGERASRETMLKRIRQERSAHEQAVQELAAASARLNQLLQDLQQRARSIRKRITKIPGHFAQRRHTLPWPTRGRVVTRFGKVRHPRFNTYIYNKGIDIQGTIGQNVFSVAPGSVIFAAWFEGYGRMVILDHGEGYNTIYAHLQTIGVSEGQAITEHQVIGQLGDSGTWKGPVLYFELRQRGEALNPQPWLE